MDILEQKAMVEANNLTQEQLDSFYKELQTIPSIRSPLTGNEAVLAFKFMEDTGSRVTEMTHVRKSDINFDTRILTITNPKVASTCKCSTWRYRDLQTRIRVLDNANPNCKDCHGLGKWKKPQKTTITPRLIIDIQDYCKHLEDNGLLFPVHRYTLWRWGKEAGKKAGLNIFQVKDEKEIEGIFLHLFRALCSKRMVRDAMGDPFRDQLVAQKLRHSFNTVTDRYTKIDINYLWSWEQKTYDKS